MIYEVRNTFGDIHAYVLPVQAGRVQRCRRPAAAGQAVLRLALHRHGDALSFPGFAARRRRQAAHPGNRPRRAPARRDLPRPPPRPDHGAPVAVVLRAAAGHLEDRRGDPLGSVAALAQGRTAGAAPGHPATGNLANTGSNTVLASGKQRCLYCDRSCMPEEERSGPVTVDVRHRSFMRRAGHRATSFDGSADAGPDLRDPRQCRGDAAGPAAPGPAGARLRLEAAARHPRRHAARRPHRPAGRRRAGPGGGDDALQLRLCLAASERRRHRHRRGLSARRMGHARPDPVPLSVLRQSRPDPGHAGRQAADALCPDRPALVQPQHQAAGAPQHLRPLRHRQCVLLGVARPEHDLFLGAVRGRHRRI